MTLKMVVVKLRKIAHPVMSNSVSPEAADALLLESSPKKSVISQINLLLFGICLSFKYESNSLYLSNGLPSKLL